MNEITLRYLEIIAYLTENKGVSGRAGFAALIGVSTSSITEISKGRTNVGLAAIHKTVLKFPFINLQWLITGEGEMLRNENAALKVEIPPEPIYIYKESPEKDEIIKLQRDQIELLKEKIKSLERSHLVDARLDSARHAATHSAVPDPLTKRATLPKK